MGNVSKMTGNFKILAKALVLCAVWPSVLACVIITRDVQMGLIWYLNNFLSFLSLNIKSTLHCDLSIWRYEGDYFLDTLHVPSKLNGPTIGIFLRWPHECKHFIVFSCKFCLNWTEWVLCGFNTHKKEASFHVCLHFLYIVGDSSRLVSNKVQV